MRSASYFKHPGLALALLCGGGLMLCSGCSIYKSKGRDQFESRAPGNVETNVGAAVNGQQSELSVNEDFSSCWIQNQDEPLWATPKGSSLQIRSINDKKMAVCLETEQHD